MENGSNWYATSQDHDVPQVALDSVQDAHRLLSSYPTTTATSTAHVARHTGQMSFVASPPVFAQHDYYSIHTGPYAAHQHQTSSEYGRELHYLNGARDAGSSRYWQGMRGEAVRLVSEQAHPNHYGAPHTIWTPQSTQTSYRTNRFANSLFQYAASSIAYPTPPPPPNFSVSSSSSLANALGPLVPPYSRTDSPQFFDAFLAQNQSVQPNIPASSTSFTTPRNSISPTPEDNSSPPTTVQISQNATPRKRKAQGQISSPSVKRIHSKDSLVPRTPGSHIPSTPTSMRVSEPPETPLSSIRLGGSSSVRRTMAYVEIPPSPYRTTSMKRVVPLLSSPPEEKNANDPSPTKMGGASRRTGDRDDRGPLEKLETLLEDIFEAEDSLPAEYLISELPGEFFSPRTVECSQPLLHQNIIRKLKKAISNVSRPTRRLLSGATGLGATPRGKPRTTEVEPQALTRILKFLLRTLKAGEHVDPFADFSKQVTKQSDGEGLKTENDIDAFESGRKIAKVAELLEIVHESVLAAECVMALLASDRLPAQLYSEETIALCLGILKDHLSRVVYPFVEAAADIHTSSVNPIIRELIDDSNQATDEHRNLFQKIFHAIGATFPFINVLISTGSVSMSDTIVIQGVYLSIGPFFVSDGNEEPKSKKAKETVLTRLLGKSSFGGLRMQALTIVRNVFARHPEQRTWIIEEILNSLIKLSDSKSKPRQFKLRNGGGIRLVSALLLQLVQTSAHDVRLSALSLHNARMQSAASFQSQKSDGKDESMLDEHDRDEIRMYNSALDSAAKSAKTIILFLTQRSGKNKSTKNSNETEYRAIFENLLQDLLTILHWPEWPSASFVLTIACKYMVTSLDDVKTANQSDNNALKSIALDHLGVIAARIRSTALKMDSSDRKHLKGLRSLDEIVRSASMQDLDTLLAAHSEVAGHLATKASEDQAYDSAQAFTCATLGHELASALSHMSDRLSGSRGDEPVTSVAEFGDRIKAALRDVWREHLPDVFDASSSEETIRCDMLAEEIGSVQALHHSFQSILNVILASLDSPAIFMRTKALRSLAQILTSDPAVLMHVNVRKAIESHLLDSSSAVRDAAVELIGKYMVDSPVFANNYYPKIADRIADTGLSVRKRVIKLLKSYYSVTDDKQRKVDIGTRLVLRMLDEDDTVKDLAIKCLEDLWFSQSVTLDKAFVFMGVCSSFQDRQSPLEDMLLKIVTGKSEAQTTLLHEQYKEICDTLVDALVDGVDSDITDPLGCIRSILVLTTAYPGVLSVKNASTLLPYLRSTGTLGEQTQIDYVLKTFRHCIPALPRTSTKFGIELQTTLQPMILRPPPSSSSYLLQETVACMCTVVKYLTHEHNRLTGLLKSCNARIQQAICSSPSTDEKALRTLRVLITIVSLLVEYCDFDGLRLSHSNLASDLLAVSEASITDHVYHSLLRLYERFPDVSFRGCILQCLGSLFRAHPRLMTLETSTQIMDDVFASKSEESRSRLLKIVQEFLISEDQKYLLQEKNTTQTQIGARDVDMAELIGNTEGFANSGVASAIVQRYFGHILDAALSQSTHIQTTAIEILTFTVKQGLAHPMQSFPVILALETSPTPAVSARAYAIHAQLHHKHASLLNTRFLLSAKASFDYQENLTPGRVRGYRMQPHPVALLQRWYSLVRDKRVSRQEFLKSLVKVFQDQHPHGLVNEDINFARYMAENFASLEFKTLEEVLLVIRALTATLSTVGLASHGWLASSISDREDSSTTVKSTSLLLQIDQLRVSVIVGVVMRLKMYLKELYSLSEEKCTKFIPGKKSALGDRPTIRKHERPITWDSLPFAISAIETHEDAIQHRNSFLSIWDSDGLTAEPMDDLDS